MAANYLLVSVIYNKSGFPPACPSVRQAGRRAGKPNRLKTTLWAVHRSDSVEKPNPHTHYEARY